MRTFGQTTWRRRFTNRANIAQACFAPVDLAWAQSNSPVFWSRQKHVQRQEAIVVVVAVEEPTLLMTVHLVVGSIEIQVTPSLRGARLNEAMNCSISTSCNRHANPRPHGSQTGTMSTELASNSPRDQLPLQRQVAAQGVMVVQIFVARCASA